MHRVRVACARRVRPQVRRETHVCVGRGRGDGPTRGRGPVCWHKPASHATARQHIHVEASSWYGYARTLIAYAWSSACRAHAERMLPEPEVCMEPPHPPTPPLSLREVDWLSGVDLCEGGDALVEVEVLHLSD